MIEVDLMFVFKIWLNTFQYKDFILPPQKEKSLILFVAGLGVSLDTIYNMVSCTYICYVLQFLSHQLSPMKVSIQSSQIAQVETSS